MDEGSEREQPKNWVGRKKRAEELLEAKKDVLWQDVRAAIEEACRSFNRLYGGQSSTEDGTGFRLRVNLVSQRKIEIDFERETGIVKANYIGAPTAYRYEMQADTKDVFLVDVSDQRRLTPDEASERILKPVFFPAAPIQYGGKFLG